MPIPINSITQSGEGVYTNLSDSETYFNSEIFTTTASLSEIKATPTAGSNTGPLIINRLGGAVGIGAIPTSSLTINGNSSHTTFSGSSPSNADLTLDTSIYKYFYYTRTFSGTSGDTKLTASINNFKDGSEIYIFMTSVGNTPTSTEMHVRCSTTTTNYKNPNISGATNGSILYWGQYSTNNHTIKFPWRTDESIALHLVSFGNTFYGSVISNGLS
jgi:hypothetical protein